jgi:aminoglycoside phosphotransferase (APT) family kinase protein
VSEAVPTRDPVETATTLERWLGAQLGAEPVSVSDLSIPKAGFSNETIVGRAVWTADSRSHVKEFVLRIEATEHQLYLDSDALRQAEVIDVLAGHVPVPELWLSEGDSAVLGAPFFMMGRVHGRIPGDVPCWHKRGWTFDLEPSKQRLVHDNALHALAELHAIDTSGDEFNFINDGVGHVDSGGTELERYVARLERWRDWVDPVVRYGVDTIDEALAFARSELPSDDRRGFVWGDARMGNIIFSDDLAVAALLDWEAARLGPPEIDVAWWVMFDEFLCEASGLTRLPGVHDRLATFERYEEITGVGLENLGYCEVLAGLQLALINSSLADLLIRTGKAPEAMAIEFVTRVTDITRRALDRFESA